MALSHVATASNYATGSGTSLACSSSLNVAAGDLLVAVAAWEEGSGGTLGVSDGGSNTCTMTAEANQGGQPYLALGYLLSATANATATFTFTNSTSRGYRGIVVLQFRPDGGETVTLDAGPSAAGGSSTTAQSGNITTAGTDAVAVAGARAYLSVNPSARYIGDVAVDTDHVSAGLTRTWWRFLTEAMTDGHGQLTWDGTSAWVASIIAFKSAAGGAPEPATVADSDTATVTDSQGITLSHLQTARSDSASVTEGAFALLDVLLVSGTSESVSVTEGIGVAASSEFLAVALSDAIAASDKPYTWGDWSETGEFTTADFSDSVSVSESAFALLDVLLVSQTEAVSSTEAVAEILDPLLASLSESVVTSDLDATRLEYLNASVLDAVESSDGTVVDRIEAAVPVLLLPDDLSTGIERPVTFSWEAFPNATLYHLEADDAADFLSPEVDIFTASTSYEASTLSDSTKYYWRVQAMVY